jgi:hypothetical protein
LISFHTMILFYIVITWLSFCLGRYPVLSTETKFKKSKDEKLGNRMVCVWGHGNVFFGAAKGFPMSEPIAPGQVT